MVECTRGYGFMTARCPVFGHGEGGQVPKDAGVFSIHMSSIVARGSRSLNGWNKY